MLSNVIFIYLISEIGFSLYYSNQDIHNQGRRLTELFTPGTLTFVSLKEALKRELALAQYQGHLYSDYANVAAANSYFSPEPAPTSVDTHLIVCVHGLDGKLSRTFFQIDVWVARVSD
ncbi:unnamed protein product [Protopolystoma xenopodis]|uniref:DUF676 domain-containing protein n=1 Tax=Protopolystoma xenopodis TaxID=117903 RepID=A0A448WHM4_9PLAT|nr:unnamed protein product [Protopolystoma xenopodis]